MARLLLIKKGEVITQFNLPAGGVGIGRSAVNEIRLKSPSVSERHARIFTSDSGSVIKDLSSALGTFVNDRSVTRCDLRDNDLILIGSYKLKYLQHDGGERAAPTAAAAPEPEAVPPVGEMPAAPAAFVSTADQHEPASVANGAQLLVLNGVNQGAVINLTRDRLVLGRDHKRSVVIEPVGHEFLVSSLPDASAAALNGKPLNKPVVLCDQDELLVDDVSLRFTIDGSHETD